MKILGIDSSGLAASVAVVENNILRGEFTVNYKKTHSETLLPMLDKLLEAIGISLNEIDAIAVASGPGSFTGLRIGSAMAKGFGLALNKPLIPVPTLEGLAYNIYDTDKIVCPIMDARRNQVYTAAFEWKDQQMRNLIKQKAVGVEELIEELNNIGKEVVFLGDGVDVYKEIICKKSSVLVNFAPAHLNKQRASAIAARAMSLNWEENQIDASEFIPEYLRLSQAERERLERERKEQEGK